MILTLTEDLSGCQGALRVDADIQEDVWRVRGPEEQWYSRQQWGVRKLRLLCHVSWHLCSASGCSPPPGGFGPVHCLTPLCSPLSFSISTKLGIVKVSRCGPIVYDLNKRDFPSAVYKLVPSQGVHFGTVLELILPFF